MKMELVKKLFEVVPHKDLKAYLCPTCSRRGALNFQLNTPDLSRTLHYCECQGQLITVDGGQNQEKVLLVHDISPGEFHQAVNDAIKLQQTAWKNVPLN